MELWLFLALAAAVSSALIMLGQEKFRVEPFAMAVWCKVACVIITLPMVAIYGFPTSPYFYGFMAIQALMFAVADILLFKAIPIVGAGVVSRLMPTTILLSFVAWFAFDPSLLAAYAQKPFISSLILGIFILTLYFGMRLKKCAVTMEGFRRVWFVIAANAAGVIVPKLALQHAPSIQGPIAFTFVEAWMMIAMWLFYILAFKPVPIKSLLEPQAVKGGLITGTAMAFFVIFCFAAIQSVDNPGYVSAIRFLDAVFIIAIHRLIHRKDESDKTAGMGIVACAIALIVLKEQIVLN
jgi:hypothetical protein